MTAWYNEPDPYAARWLRNLIAAGHIAPGVVDERSIADVRANELAGFTQCHFFAGIGVWSRALRVAGWPDERPVWTGSCPCQPFSAAGKQKGFDDERHLWPVWHRLIEERRPAIVLGEQVASALDWLDLVSADMEASGYAFAAADLCAAGFGGAHIRQRLYFAGVADADGRQSGHGHLQPGREHGLLAEGGSALREGREGARPHAGRGLAQSYGGERQRLADGEGRQPNGEAAGWQQGDRLVAAGGFVRGLADAECDERRKVRPHAGGSGSGEEGLDERPVNCGDERRPHAPLLGRDAADWLYCRDGKWRPVEPGTFPLVDAAPARVGRLRAYGNALDAETAAQFVGAVMEAL